MRYAAVTWLVVLAIMAACGHAPTAPEAVDPCALITKSEAEAALDRPVRDAFRHTNGDFRSCHFTVAVDESSRVQLMVFVRHPEHFDRFVAAARAIYGAEPQRVPGLGTRAAWVGRQLLVTDEHGLMGVIVEGSMDGDVARERARVVARRALDRLG